MDRLGADLWKAVRSRRHLTVDLPEGTGRTLEALGERLFSALFAGEILALYQRSLDLLDDDAETGLRIELMFDPRDPELAPLQALPWELLRQPGTPELLALSRRTPIVRYPALPRSARAVPQPRVLRILAVAANPQDENLPSLDLARELRNLQDATRSARRLEVVPLKAPTLAALRQACSARDYHVVHFMGHGGSIPDVPERVLFFETENGTPEPVRGADLVNTLADFPTVRLVVLNACESAAPPEEASREDFEPLSGVASSLVLGGLPAVVAMRCPISDDAAIEFSRAFYQQLAAGEPVDAAVAEARQAVHSKDPGGLEWVTPALFLSTPDGELFTKGTGSRRWIRAFLLLLLLGGAVFATHRWQVERLVAQGVVLYDDGQWLEARKRFAAAQRRSPGSAEILSYLAATEEKLGDSGAAEKRYREAVRLRPDSASHLFNLGHFLNDRQEHGEAYTILKRAVARDPERADAYGELARAALGLGMPGRARVALRVGLQLDPEQPALYRRLGEVELRAGHPQAAISALNEARRRYKLGDLGRVETTWLLIQAYDRLGNVPLACWEIRELRRLDAPGVTPWAPEAEAVAARRRCPSP